MITAVIFSFISFSIFSFALIKAAASNDFECVGVSGLKPLKTILFMIRLPRHGHLSVFLLYGLQPNPRILKDLFLLDQTSFRLIITLKELQLQLFPTVQTLEVHCRSSSQSKWFHRFFEPFIRIQVHHASLQFETFDATYTMACIFIQIQKAVLIIILKNPMRSFSIAKQFLDHNLLILSEILEPKLVEKFILAVMVRFNASNPDFAQIRIAVKYLVNANYLHFVLRMFLTIFCKFKTISIFTITRLNLNHNVKDNTDILDFNKQNLRSLFKDALIKWQGSIFSRPHDQAVP